jgi:DNA-binding MarR family transcriptional regulator
MPPVRHPATRAASSLVAVAPLVTRWVERLLALHAPPLTVTQYLVLRAVDAGTDSAASLARAGGVTEAAVSQVIAVLEQEQLVTRAPLAGDRRRQSLALSVAGRDALRSAERTLASQIATILEPLGPRERDALGLALEQVEAMLGDRPPPRRPPPPPRPHPGRRHRPGP